MTENRYETLSALVDGEPVDPQELAEVLALPEAPEVLIDFMQLRAGIRKDTSRPGSPVLDGPGPRSRRGTLQGVSALVAAALLFVIGLVWVHSSMRTAPPAAPTSPPSAARELRFERGVDWSAVP